MQIRHYSEWPIIVDGYLRGYFVELLIAAAADAVVAAGVAANFEGYSVGPSTAAAAAACLRHHFVDQLTDFAVYLWHFLVGPLAVAADGKLKVTAASLVLAVDEC